MFTSILSFSYDAREKIFILMKYNMESNREVRLIFAESRLCVTKTLIVF